MSSDRNNVPVFDGTNFGAWKFRMKLYLQSKEVDTALLQAPGNTAADAGARKIDVKARSLIANGLTDTQLAHVMGEESASSMWAKLAAIYDRQDSSLQVAYEKQLSQLVFDFNKMTREECIAKFDALANKVRSAGGDLTEDKELTYLTLKLPSSMNHVNDIVDLLPAGKSKLAYVKSKILTESTQTDDKTDTKVKVEESSDSDSRNMAAFNTQRDRNSTSGQQQRGGNDYDGRRDMECYGCGKKGHLKRFCRNKWNKQSNNGQRGRSNRRFNRGGRGGGKSNRYQPQQQQQQQSRRVETWVLQVDKEESPVSAYNSNTDSNPNSSSNKMTWLVDSGATDNIICKKEYFSKCIKLKKPTSVKMGDDYPHKSNYIGTVNINFLFDNKITSCTVKNVYLVESLGKNLLSVPTMDIGGYRVLCGDGKAVLINPNWEAIGTGILNGRLYEFSCTYEGQTGGEISSCLTTVNKDKIYWHRVLGHVNFHSLKELNNCNLLEGFTDVSDGYVQCDLCDRNKLRNLSFGAGRARAHDVLEIVHTDVNGPHRLGNKSEKFFVTFIDDYSKYVVVYCVKAKSDIFDCFVDYHNKMVNITGRQLGKLRCDNGGEYMNKNFFEFSRQKGFIIQNGPPYTPQLNGVAERYNQTIMNRANCLFDESDLDKKYWPEVVKTAVYLGNRILANSVEKKTPFEIVYGYKPDVSNLVLYGSPCFIRVPDQKRHDKWSKKGAQGVVVGYSSEGYRVLCDGEILVTRNVKIIDPKKSRIVYVDSEDDEVEEEPNSPVVIPRRSERESKPPDRYGSPILYFTQVGIPETYEEACSSVRAKDWIAAADKELKNIEENDTWYETDLPEGKKALDLKWVFTEKADDLLKARLVVRGFQQDDEIEELYSPVVSMAAVKTYLSLAVNRKWLIKQLDVQTAFLNGKIKSEVYVNFPPGHGSRTSRRKAKRVLRLKKALYGLRESPRCWYECLDEYLRSLGFRCLDSERCVYVRGNIFVLVYVDDLLICGGDEKEIEEIIRLLCKRFRMRTMGPISRYLGIDVKYDREIGRMELSQAKYIEELATKYRVHNSRHRFNTPMETGLKLEKGGEVTSDQPFRSLVGALQYVAAATRMDISFAIGYLSRFQSCYTDEYFQYAIRILIYLYHSRNLCLVYTGGNNNLVDCYVDADFAGDIVDRKSTSGFVIRVNGNPVLWKSVKQGAVTRASTHAEYYAMADATQELVWMAGLLEEFGERNVYPVSVYEDNSGAIALANSGKFTGKSKFIEIALRFVYDLVVKNQIVIHKVDTKYNLADILTKALDRSQFLFLRDLLNLSFSSHGLR